MGADFDRNRELIFEHERAFARQIAGKVVDKPQLAMWMILIPIFFVFYFFQLKRYKNGLKDFARNFLVSRERTLDEVWEAATSNKQVDLEKIVAVSTTPAESKDQYRVWVEALAEHFQLLLKSQGDTYEALVRDAYKKKSSYQKELKNLNRIEADYHRALAAHLPGEQESIKAVITSMQSSVKELRRSQAEEIFP